MEKADHSHGLFQSRKLKGSHQKSYCIYDHIYNTLTRHVSQQEGWKVIFSQNRKNIAFVGFVYITVLPYFIISCQLNKRGLRSQDEKIHCILWSHIIQQQYTTLTYSPMKMPLFAKVKISLAGELYPSHLLHIFPYIHYPFYRISLCARWPT